MENAAIEPGLHEWNSLLQAARSGDDRALGEICERLRQYLLLTVDGDLGSDLTSKLGSSDIVQDTMFEACRDFASFRGSSEFEYRAWIKRLLERNLLDAAKRYRHAGSRCIDREVTFDDGSIPASRNANDKTASSILCRNETDEELFRAIARLPEKQRQIIELRHRDGLSHAEIATVMNMTEAAVRKSWSRSVQMLTQELSTQDEPRTSQSR